MDQIVWKVTSFDSIYQGWELAPPPKELQTLGDTVQTGAFKSSDVLQNLIVLVIQTRGGTSCIGFQTMPGPT